MNSLWLSWIFDSMLIVLILSLSASVVSFSARTILRVTMPLDLAVVVLLAVYTCIAWACFYHYHIPLSQLLRYLGWGLVIGLLSQLIINVLQKKSVFDTGEWLQWLKAAFSFWLFTVFLSILYFWFIQDTSLPVAVEINNDVWVYSKYAHIALLQPIGNNIIGFDYFKTDLVEQTPTAFLLISALSFLLNKPIINVLSLGLILLMAYSAHAIKTICLQYFQQQKAIAWLIALVWLTTPLITHLSFNFFLAQWLGIAVFFAILLTALQRDRPFFIQLTLLSLLYYLLFMSYPGFYIPYVFLLLFVQMSAAYYWRRAINTSFWSKDLISSFIAIPISTLIEVVQNPVYFQKMVAAFQRLASEPYFLSERSLLNPLNFASLPPINSQLFHFLIGLSLLALTLYLSLTLRMLRTQRLLLLSALYLLFFITYELYFCIYLGLLLLIKTGDLLFYKRKNHREYFNPYVTDILLMVPVLLTVFYWIDPSQFMRVAHHLVTQEFIMKPYFDFDMGSVRANLIGSMYLIALIMFYSYRMHKEETLTHPRLILCSLFIVNLLFYLAYYQWKGYSYQQWKVAVSLVQILSFIPVLAIFYLLKTQLNTCLKQCILGGLLLINLILLDYVVSPWMNDLKKYIPLTAMTALDQDPTVKQVLIDIEESNNQLPKKLRGMFMAIQFVNQKPLAVTSFFTNSRKTQRLTKGTVVITNHCTSTSGQNIPLGTSFCMIKID